MTETETPLVVRQLFRDFIKSISGLLSNIILLTALVDIVGISPQIAAILSVALLLVAAYFVTNKWVFASESSTNKTEHGVRFGGYVLVYWFGMGLKYILYLVLLPYIAYQLAWIVGAGTVFFVTFLGNRWLWTNTKTLA